MPKASTIPKVRFNLKEYKDKDGEQQILAVFRYPQKDPEKPRRKLTYYTGIKVIPKYWKKTEAIESVNYPKGHQINVDIALIKATILSIYKETPYLDTSEFRNEIAYKLERKARPQVIKSDYISFEQAFEKEIAINKKRVQGKQGGQVWNQLSYTLNKLRKFCKEQSTNLSYEAINHEFRQNFIEWMEEKGRSQNTIRKELAKIKKIMTSYRKHHNNPIIDDKKFLVDKVVTTKHYPTLDELKTLFNHKFEDKKHREVIVLYLVSAFGGGLRISDVLSLSEENLTSIDGENVLHVFTYKGRDRKNNEVFIPITPQLQSLIDEYKWEFPKYEEDDINDTLKVAFEVAGLTREKLMKSGVKGKENELRRLCDVVHFHTARSSYIDFMLNIMGVRAEDLRLITGQTLQTLLQYVDSDGSRNAVKVGAKINSKLQGLRVVKNEAI